MSRLEILGVALFAAMVCVAVTAVMLVIAEPSR